MIMRHSLLRRRATALLAVALSAATALGAAAGKQLWTAKLPGDAKWHALTGLGTLLVGTSDAILAFDPDTGQQLWSRSEFKKTSPHNARELPGTPYMICHTADGIGGTKVKLAQIDYLTGKTVWETAEIQGQYLGTVPVIGKNLVLFLLNSFGTDGKEAGIYIRAFDLQGKEKWATRFAKSGGIPLHVADNSGKFIPTMDLSGYHEPVIDGDEIFLGYLGAHCLDLNTGALKWAVEFPSGAPGLKRAYAPLRVELDRVYGGGGGSVYAIDRKTGSQIWKSDRISEYAGLFKARDNAIVAQLEVVNGKIFSRYGGNFSDGKNVTLREPLGIVVLDPADGKALYHFDKAKEGITNLVIVPETNLVVFADGANVYGIDAAAPAPVEAFKMPIEFKRKMGAASVAKIGLGALGGVSGLVKATVSANKALLDVPVAVSLVGGKIVVQGKQHLLGFDPATRTSSWSLFYAAPSDALGNAALFAVTAAAAVYGNAQAAASGGFATSSYSSGVNTIHSSLDRYNQYTERAAKRAGGSRSSQSYTYIVTKVEKDIGVVGVNLESGETDRELVLKEKEPDYRVDEAMNRVFHFRANDTVIAYQF
jgi:outer membrane protein assembly factor BamB